MRQPPGRTAPSLLALVMGLLSVGVLTSPATSQPTDVPVEPQPPSDAADRPVTQEPPSMPDGDASPPGRSRDPRDRLWRQWPRTPGSRGYDGWTPDGAPFHDADGRLCWPHGDHFHCR
jgi:hypothetical protein